jgi:hypothetical protein
MNKGLSLILASRSKDNPDSKLQNLLDSLAVFTEHHYEEIEVLIKFDQDDDKRPDDSLFKQYPFDIKVFVYGRGEGRHYNHHHCEYLFANRNPSFKWVMNVSDDFMFTRPFLNDLYKIEDDYMIVGYTTPTFAQNAKAGTYKTCFPVNFQYDNGIGEYCPLMTAKLAEVCQNWGWQPNPDAWVVLLEMTLYKMFRMILWKKIDKFYERTGSYGSGDTPTFPGSDLYNNMTITGRRLPTNHYLFKLIEQQAKNIYLNMAIDVVNVGKYKIDF